jgi:hypothetical protein
MQKSRAQLPEKPFDANSLVGRMLINQNQHSPGATTTMRDVAGKVTAVVIYKASYELAINLGDNLGIE